MVKEIIERAKAEILAEKDFKIREECAKVENEMIAPKFAEFDSEAQNSIAFENDRHSKEVQRISEANEKNKNDYATRIRGSIESLVESKYHYSEIIKGLDKLIGE